MLVCSLEPNEITNCKLCDFGVAREVNLNMTLAQGEEKKNEEKRILYVVV